MSSQCYFNALGILDITSKNLINFTIQSDQQKKTVFGPGEGKENDNVASQTRL